MRIKIRPKLAAVLWLTSGYCLAAEHPIDAKPAAVVATDSLIAIPVAPGAPAAPAAKDSAAISPASTADPKSASDALGMAYEGLGQTPSVPAAGKSGAGDSLTALPASADEQPKTAAKSDAAVGTALLPARPESEAMHFEKVKASEVILRFGKEYRVSIILSGDGSTEISGSTPRTDSVEAMLKTLFPEPTWQVSAKSQSVLITQRPTLSFRKISMEYLNPPLPPTATNE